MEGTVCYIAPEVHCKVAVTVVQFHTSVYTFCTVVFCDKFLTWFCEKARVHMYIMLIQNLLSTK